ncbi:MAG TPA: carboxypeptidase-like regulatory domain-containing protein, partial [Candidatus Acidoferrales bacterium]|nr:carboxypeptidase-like regulatory domain-containing protein [Candidatus Acidoferrales bacterium]
MALAALLVFAAAFSATAAGTVSGAVNNGTTNTPVRGTEVILMQLQGGMEPVATTKTDASGHFTITNDALGAGPMLLRVPYKGVLYHEPIAPGATTANVTVYEPTTDAHSFAVTTRAIVLQPKGSDLLVGEEYTIQNQTHPPVAYYLKDGTFKFQVPQGGQLNQVSAWGATGMPVIQGTIDKGNGVEAVDWPFRPGDNGVRLSYQLPYASNQASFHTASLYNVQRVLLVVPPGLQVSSPGFTPAGTQQGYDIYTRDSVAANAPLTISISGTASEPPPADNSQDSSVNSRADANGEAAATTTLPPRLSNNLQYILVVGFAALFLLGVIFLWRRPVTETIPPAAANAMSPKKGRDRHRDTASVNPPEQRSNAPQSVAEVEREVTHSLDELKEKLFRLELRRQAGTISEEEYAREHQRTEKILRDFVKG